MYESINCKGSSCLFCKTSRLQYKASKTIEVKYLMKISFFFIYAFKGKKLIINKQIFCYGLMWIGLFILMNSFYLTFACNYRSAKYSSYIAEHFRKLFLPL